MTGSSKTAEAVICGAGIAGVSAAYFLTAHFGTQDVILVDENPPLSLTSDHSTECYRNWWPDEAMVTLMNRSIDWFERLADESGNVFNLNRRGYLYCSGNLERAERMKEAAEAISHRGAGPLRIHRGQAGDPVYKAAAQEGYKGQPEGADLLLEQGLIRQHFPGISSEVISALHIRRAGWFSAQQLGMYLLQQARQHGARILQQHVVGVDGSLGRIQGVLLADKSYIKTPIVVLACGPFLHEAGRMLGVELPVFNELHLKVAFNDPLGVVPRDAPLLIWTDLINLDWSPEERRILTEEKDLLWMLGELPPGVHARPEGGPGSQMILGLWEYHSGKVQPVFPIPLDPQYPEIVLRGLCKILPGMQAYLGRFPKPRVDGGYYTKTTENRPIIGKLPIQGAFIIGALSGFGMMASCAAGELLAAHVAGATLPDYAPEFSLTRYDDPSYLKRIETIAESGQL